MSKEELVKIIIPFIWSKFKVFLNNPSYFVRGEDVLASVFMRGEDDVQLFIAEINKKLKSLENPKPKRLRYIKNLTYHDVLTKFVKL